MKSDNSSRPVAAGTIQGYSVIESVARGVGWSLFRAQTPAGTTGALRLLRLPDAGASTREVALSFRRELAACAQAECPRSLLRPLSCHSEPPLLVYPDFPGRPPAERRFGASAETLIRAILSAVAEIHDAGLTHGSLQPSCVLVSEDHEVRVLGVGATAGVPGTLVDIRYAAPELTGRLGAPFDQRADLYALGVLFYELLTSRLPFRASDASGLIHAHLATVPRAPSELEPGVDPRLGAVVLRLLRKDPAERYPSAAAVLADLERRVVSVGDTIRTRLREQKRLYGRERELELLETAVAEAQEGSRSLVFVCGPSGSGKTHLMEVLTARRPVPLCSGKFDQILHSPYSVFAQALGTFLRSLLSREASSGLAAWRRVLRDNIGANLALIAEVLPDLRHLVGDLPPVPEVPPLAAENRVRRVWMEFIRAVCSESGLLVLFLDDLQWADEASLRLIGDIAQDSKVRGICLIGAYRDDEVGSEHPLSSVLTRVSEIEGESLRVLQMEPLTTRQTAELISYATDTPARECGELARTVAGRTHGNPLFVVKFLESLGDRGLIARTSDPVALTWDAEAIAAASLPTSVIEIIAERLSVIPLEDLRTLRVAALLGETFGSHLLSRILCVAEDRVEDRLRRATETGILLCSGRSYRFAHDRIQQALVHGLTDKDRAALHLRIGQSLTAGVEAGAPSRLAAVDHLNQAIPLLRSPDERADLARTNLEAAVRTRASGAYDAAAAYAETGIELLGQAPWAHRYERALALHESLAEAAFLLGDFDRARRALETIVRKARSPEDTVQATVVAIQLAYAKHDLFGAVETALDLASKLGVKIPRSPGPVVVGLALARAYVLGSRRSLRRIATAPAMTDRASAGALAVLAYTGIPLYVLAPTSLPVVLVELVRLTRRRGVHSISPYALVMLGMILASRPPTIERGFRVAQTGLRLLERVGGGPFAARTAVFHEMFVRHWNVPLRDTIEPLKAAVRMGMAWGDHEIAAMAAHYRTFHSYFAGLPLPEVAKSADADMDLIRELRQQRAVNGMSIFLQYLDNLTCPREDPILLDGERMREERMLETLRSTHDRTAIFGLLFFKLFLCTYFDRPDDGLELIDRAYDNGRFPMALIDYPIYTLHEALTLMRADGPDSRIRRRRLRRARRRLAAWSRRSPHNNRHRHLLVEAMWAARRGRARRAARLYEQAALEARQRRVLHELPLALEYASRFHNTCGHVESGASLLAQARAAYEQWGAVAVADRLTGGSSKALR